MSCTGCARRFNIFRSERSCQKCRFSFCSKCLTEQVCRSCLNEKNSWIRESGERNECAPCFHLQEEDFLHALDRTIHPRDVLLRQRLDNLRHEAKSGKSEASVDRSYCLKEPSRRKNASEREQSPKSQVDRLISQTAKEVALENRIRQGARDVDEELELRLQNLRSK